MQHTRNILKTVSRPRLLKNNKKQWILNKRTPWTFSFSLVDLEFDLETLQNLDGYFGKLFVHLRTFYGFCFEPNILNNFNRILSLSLFLSISLSIFTHFNLATKWITKFPININQWQSHYHWTESQIDRTIGDRRRITRAFDSSSVQQEFHWPGCKLLLLCVFCSWINFNFCGLIFLSVYFYLTYSLLFVKLFMGLVKNCS